MGPIAISFGIACAVVLAITALCRSWGAAIAALVSLLYVGLNQASAASSNG